MTNIEFLMWCGSKINPRIRWQLKLLNIIYRISRWIRISECKNEGHLQLPRDYKQQFGLCPRCQELIVNTHYNYYIYDDKPFNYMWTFTPYLVVKSNIPSIVLTTS